MLYYSLYLSAFVPITLHCKGEVKVSTRITLLPALILILIIQACAPTEETIASAIAETKAAWTPIPTQTPLPTYTAYPTYTPNPSKTPSPSPEHTPTAAASSTPKATNTRRPTSTKRPTPETGKWKTQTSSSSFDDSKTVVISLDANSTIEGWTVTYLPKLILRCEEGKVDAFVRVGMPADVEYSYNAHTARIRFDDDDAYKTTMNESTDGEALFFQGAVTLINQMQEHDTMLFGFTPFNANPVETTFTLTGIRYAVVPLAEACNS